MKRIVKVLTSFVIIVSIVLTAMLTTFAYSVNGVELVPITLSSSDYENMFADGGFTVQYTLSSPTSVDITVFDMLQNASSSVVTVNSSGYTIPLTTIHTINNNTITFGSRYAYNLRVNSNSTLQQQVVMDLPFGYYLDNASINCYVYNSGTSSTSNSFNLSLRQYSSDGTSSSQIGSVLTRNINPSIRYWSSIDTISQWVSDNNIVTFPSGYTFDSSSTGIRTNLSIAYYSGISTDVKVDGLLLISYVDATHTSGTGYNYSFIVPVIFSVYLPSTVYVDPDIADTVQEYLDLIVNPSSEAQERIQDLKDEFEAQSEALHDAADDLHKYMPTLPTVSGLPQEVTEGVQEASQYVITPLFGVGIVGTVVGTCLVFAVIKLLLYGSGPS